MKPVAIRGEPDEHGETSDHRGDGAPESGSHVAEIVEGSKAKAQTMVDAAVQVCITFRVHYAQMSSSCD